MATNHRSSLIPLWLFPVIYLPFLMTWKEKNHSFGCSQPATPAPVPAGLYLHPFISSEVLEETISPFSFKGVLSYFLLLSKPNSKPCSMSLPWKMPENSKSQSVKVQAFVLLPKVLLKGYFTIKMFFKERKVGGKGLF